MFKLKLANYWSISNKEDIDHTRSSSYDENIVMNFYQVIMITYLSSELYSNLLI